MKANNITVILMTFIVSITAFANERQRMCHAALDRDDFKSPVFCIDDEHAALDCVHIITKEVVVTN